MKITLQSTFIFLIMAGISCQTSNPKSMEKVSFDIDPHSYALPNEARVTHLDLSLEVNFEQRKLFGIAKYNIERESEINTISFDTEALKILNVEDGQGEGLEFELGNSDHIKGSELRVFLNSNTELVVIEYETSPQARALQWLTPEQTAQKESPFLFTQSQAILARSWIPCQDSPGIRFTYNATVKVPQGFLALMSAENPQSVDPDGVYEFKMPQPIPSYLMALSVGDIAFKAIGNRTGVYAEPIMLDRCYYEFSDMEKMLESAEEIYGPYAWGRYDVIVLPPSFPFGGMENPRLTFATPTIIAGDKSLTSLVAHELAHSWSGNLVTNATWNDFWLNEGFTVYFEQRIMEAVYGRPYSEMLAMLSYEGLKEEIAEMELLNPEDTKLKLSLEGRDPDDGMNTIAYDKGYLLLRKIEEAIGRERFDTFLKNYFSEYAFKVMDTESFLALLKNELTEGEYKEIDVDQWVYGTGLPSNHPVVVSDRFEKVEENLTSWLGGSALSEMNSGEWSTHEWIHFINSLPEGIGIEKLSDLDKSFGFTQSGNSEILAAWFSVAIREDYHEADQAVEQFLIQVGRRKFLTPTYKELILKDPTKEIARAIYAKARPNYHSVSTGTLDALLDWKL